MTARKLVLLVDDDADFVQQNRLLLEENGYDVQVAYNSRQCLETLERLRPDLIVMDMMMESKNEGFNLSRELRNREHTKSIPLLMITSVNDSIPFHVEPDRTWLPVDVLIEKPVDPSLFLEVVGRVLAK
jgi:CheY-like chemotaxis protein